MNDSPILCLGPAALKWDDLPPTSLTLPSSPPMSSSSSSITQLAREFVTCASLSFIIILGILHAFLHFLHMCITSGIALSWPSMSFLSRTLPAIQNSDIAQAHTYLVEVFNVTIACTVLILALRGIIMAVGYFRRFSTSKKDGDVEAGDCKSLVKDEASWTPGEKLSPSKIP